jgi:hypothetical protein
MRSQLTAESIQSLRRISRCIAKWKLNDRLDYAH